MSRDANPTAAPCGHTTVRVVKGMCLACYQRTRKATGDRKPRLTRSTRVWAKVDRTNPDGCWPWTGHLDDRGYGRVSVNGVMTSARRMVWELENGPPDPAVEIEHDGPGLRACCRPNHLYERRQGGSLRKGYVTP